MYTIYDSSGDAIFKVVQDSVIEVSSDSIAVISADSSGDSSANANMIDNLKSIDNNTYNISIGLLCLFALFILIHELRWWR